MERQWLELAMWLACFSFFLRRLGLLMRSIESVFSPPLDEVGQAADKACLGWMTACRLS